MFLHIFKESIKSVHLDSWYTAVISSFTLYSNWIVGGHLVLGPEIWAGLMDIDGYVMDMDMFTTHGYGDG